MRRVAIALAVLGFLAAAAWPVDYFIVVDRRQNPNSCGPYGPSEIGKAPAASWLVARVANRLPPVKYSTKNLAWACY